MGSREYPEGQPGDWPCPRCGNLNWGRRAVCNTRNCRQPRPSPEGTAPTPQSPPPVQPPDGGSAQQWPASGGPRHGPRPARAQHQGRWPQQGAGGGGLQPGPGGGARSWGQWAADPPPQHAGGGPGGAFPHMPPPEQADAVLGALAQAMQRVQAEQQHAAAPVPQPFEPGSGQGEELALLRALHAAQHQQSAELQHSLAQLSAEAQQLHQEQLQVQTLQEALQRLKVASQPRGLPPSSFGAGAAAAGGGQWGSPPRDGFAPVEAAPPGGGPGWLGGEGPAEGYCHYDPQQQLQQQQQWGYQGEAQGAPGSAAPLGAPQPPPQQAPPGAPYSGSAAGGGWPPSSRGSSTHSGWGPPGSGGRQPGPDPGEASGAQPGAWDAQQVLPPYRARYLKGQPLADDRSQPRGTTRAASRERAIEAIRQHLESVGEEDLQLLALAVSWNQTFRPYIGSLYSFIKRHDQLFVYGKASKVSLRSGGAAAAGHADAAEHDTPQQQQPEEDHHSTDASAPTEAAPGRQQRGAESPPPEGAAEGG